MEKDNHCMELILHSGEAQNYAMEAIREAKKFNFQKADELIEKAEEEQLEAHQYQTSFIMEMAREREAGKESSVVNVLLVHALDYVTSGLLSIDFAKEFIENYKMLKEMKDQIQLWK